MGELIDIAKEREYKVTKSNLLIQSARSKMTAAEMRMLVYTISKIEMGDKEFQPCEVAIADFCKVCDITPDAQYKNLREITARLRGRTIELLDDDGDTIHQLGWLRRVTYYKGKGKIVLQLEEGLAPQLLELKKNFTSYGLINVLLLKSKYAMQIYELLKSYENIGLWQIDIDDFKKLLYAESYERYPDFRRKILEPSIEEINEKTDIYAEYELEKAGRKVIGLKFIIKQNIENISKRKALRKKPAKLADAPRPEGAEAIAREIYGDYGIEKPLSVKDKKFFCRWVSLGYEYEMIYIAFERCIDATGGVHIAYIDKIINNWYDHNIDTPAAAAREQKEYQASKGQQLTLDGYESFGEEDLISAMAQEKALV